MIAVRELALFAVFARAVFLEWPAELRLVAGGVDLRARFLLQDLQLLLAALTALAAVGAVAKLVLLIHYGVLHVAVRAGGVLVAIRHGLHVAGGVSTEESRRVRVAVVGATAGGCYRGPDGFLIQHAVNVNGVHVEALLLLVQHVDVVESG